MVRGEGDKHGGQRHFRRCAARPADMFRFTTGDLAPLYGAVPYTFGEAVERLGTALNLDEVCGRLARSGLVGRAHGRGSGCGTGQAGGVAAD